MWHDFIEALRIGCGNRKTIAHGYTLDWLACRLVGNIAVEATCRWGEVALDLECIDTYLLNLSVGANLKVTVGCYILDCVFELFPLDRAIQAAKLQVLLPECSAVGLDNGCGNFACICAHCVREDADLETHVNCCGLITNSLKLGR